LIRSGVISRSHRTSTDASAPAAQYRLRRRDRHGLPVSRRSAAVIRRHGLQRPAKLRRLRRALDVLSIALSGNVVVQ